MKWLFVLERIEGPWAILETEEGETFQFPASLLPAGLHEGAYLDFTIMQNIKAENDARKEMENFRQSLKRKDQ
ncbi:DUF3006 domain-containing protein [bacterium]|nr:DUF3006 domain-containing protein [bacterium]